MEEYTLLVMAAGMGSRFGGLKQIQPVGPNGELLIEYSIYDAIKAGFNKIVFVINKDTEDYLKTHIGQKIEDKVNVEYVVQDINDLPEGYKRPENRIKPWGTGHVIYCARNILKGSFAIINADDFYGYNSYETLLDFLKNNTDRTHYLTIGYKISNTLSENGSVKRGVVRMESGILNQIIESKIVTENRGPVAYPLDGRTPFKITDDDLATVNLFAFTPNFLKAIIDKFPVFLDKNINIEGSEYLIPDVVAEQIKEGSATVYINSTTDKWHGMTYKEDLEQLQNAINNYIAEGKYPEKLWE
ncbi:MAG: nucleotidyltransferase [Bacilli bacterium]|nr:nucleotidyltransferase [Bacilli bacterium]